MANAGALRPGSASSPAGISGLLKIRSNSIASQTSRLPICYECRSDEVRVAHDLDHRGAVVGQRLDDRVVELRAVGHARPMGTADPGVLGEVGVVQRGLPDVPLPRLLLLRDLAELSVVE